MRLATDLEKLVYIKGRRRQVVRKYDASFRHSPSINVCFISENKKCVATVPCGTCVKNEKGRNVT